jgi:hypothetical protein
MVGGLHAAVAISGRGGCDARVLQEVLCVVNGFFLGVIDIEFKPLWD